MADAAIGRAFDRRAQRDNEELPRPWFYLREQRPRRRCVADLPTDLGKVADGEWRAVVPGKRHVVEGQHSLELDDGGGVLARVGEGSRQHRSPGGDLIEEHTQPADTTDHLVQRAL